MGAPLMAVVIDTSVAVAWFVPSQAGSYADRIARRVRHEALVVPSLWEVEFGNVMTTLLRRKLLARHQVASVLAKAERLDLTVDRRCGDRARAVYACRAAWHQRLRCRLSRAGRKARFAACHARHIARPCRTKRGRPAELTLPRIRRTLAQASAVNPAAGLAVYSARPLSFNEAEALVPRKTRRVACTR